jgi:acetyl-CoA acyltransferase
MTALAVKAWAADTGADLAKTNVNGGAIAIGHPLAKPESARRAG